jgi:hypothetical protein
VSAAADISWSGPDPFPGTFNLRVAAVITRGDQVLLCTVDGLGYWFLVAWPDALDPGDLHGGSEPGHTFRWVPIRELGDLDFRPAGLIPVLPGLTGTLRHVVLRSP